MKALDDIVKYLERYKTQADPAVVEALRAIGKQTIEYAFLHKDTRNILGNQMEAYGCGVYFNGQLVGQAYLEKSMYRMEHQDAEGKWHKGAEKDRRRGVHGRFSAMKALKNYVPSSKWYVLVVANAMWYSTAHESWGYQIISSAPAYAARRIEEKFGVKVSVEFYKHEF